MTVQSFFPPKKYGKHGYVKRKHGFLLWSNKYVFALVVFRQAQIFSCACLKHRWYGNFLFWGVNINLKRWFIKKKKKTRRKFEQILFGDPASCMSWLWPHVIDRANNFSIIEQKKISMLWDSHIGSVLQGLIRPSPYPY